MGDGIQQQLDRLLHLFLEEQAVNRAYREEMTSRIEALSQGGTGHDDEHTSRFQRPNNHAAGYGTVPRFTKLDFPKFNGLDDPLGWISRCDHFFQHQQTPEDDKVGLASFHLEGNAQLWFIQLKDDFPNPTWAEFTAQCHLRFGPPVRSNKFGELAKLTQTGKVSDYQTQFEILVSRAGNLSQLQKVQLYISGLKEHIAVEVELHHPPDLATAMSISRLYERKYIDVESNAPAVDPLPMPKSSGRMIKRLTHEEMIDRRRRGLCFNCDELFVRGHQCAKLFWIEVHEAEPPDEDTNTAPGT